MTTQVRSDIRNFVYQHSDQPWTGRAVARVFHGIASPNFPAKVWGRVFRWVTLVTIWQEMFINT